MPGIVKTIEDNIYPESAAAHVPPGGAPLDSVSCTGDFESPEGPDFN